MCPLNILGVNGLEGIAKHIQVQAVSEQEDMTIKEIKVARGLKIISPYPVLFLEEEKALLASDLHLGIEDRYEREGVHIPRTFLAEVIASIAEPARQINAERIVLVGDVKHEFGEPNEAEWYATKKLLKELTAIAKVEVVRGNHDNYLIKILSEFGIPLHQPSLELGGFTLAHGHVPVEGSKLVMGHEHPAVSIKDGLGIKHRYKAFLTVRADGRRIYVLPSASQLTIGTDMNLISPNDLLSPMLKGRDLSKAVPYPIEIGVAVKRFPSLASL